MGKHTAGKWIADAAHSIWQEGSCVLVAQAHGELHEKAEANARLIAASPELLEALKECILAAEIIDGQEFPPDDDDVEFMLEAHKKARAAIAKAEGGE